MMERILFTLDLSESVPTGLQKRLAPLSEGIEIGCRQQRDFCFLPMQQNYVSDRAKSQPQAGLSDAIRQTGLGSP